MQRAADLRRIGIRVAPQQRSRREDHARRAETALQSTVVEERLLQRMQLLACRERLDGSDRAAFGHAGRHLARAHVLVVDRASGWLYELFQASRNSDGSWDASNGAKWNLRTGDPRPMQWTSADAAGMPVFPGLVRYSEVEAGWIGHALRFAVNRSQRGFVWPASHAAGTCAFGSDCPPMGLRVRLKKSVDISGFSKRMQVILRALQVYGMFVADNTGNDDSWWLSGAPHPKWSDEENLTLGAIRGRDFEVVRHGEIQPQ